MNILDMRTVITGYAISDLICMVVMAVLWQQNRRGLAGLGFWLADFILQFTSLVLIALRGVVPDFLSMTTANTLIIGVTILLFIGLEQFAGKHSNQIYNLILLVVFIIIHAYFVYVFDILVVRNILLSVGLVAICAQIVWLMLRRVDPPMRVITRGVGIVLIGFCLVSIARIVVDLVVPLGNDFFVSNAYETFLLITYQMMFIALTFSLVLMVNRRLFGEMEDDVAARRRAEEIVRLRLRLWEYFSTHTIDDLLQYALDQIGELTGSPIGFYHFVEEDQKTLSLKAWSTRTLKEFCKAEGKGMRYLVGEAGVWADCVRQRAPVIHNDYASLPNRKGLPPGHAELVRELVVPTLRGDQIVSILGVGNKPIDYDAQDVELVSFIADIIWTIVERKRADEAIQQLNKRLEEQAMTDELTGLANRRSFFKRGHEEIIRVVRYGAPLSLLLMDIDNFKRINDLFGHETGDRMLKSVAGTLRASIREVDMLARLGGEEFGILLPNTAAVEAVKLAERLRLEVERESGKVVEEGTGVTVSVGVTTFEEDMEDLDALLRMADVAMYQAKNQGRNRVVYMG